jgi:hypothetical protein
MADFVAKVCRLGSFKFPRAVGVPIEKNAWGTTQNYSSLNERPPQPRYDSFDQHFLITAGFVPIFVTLHFPTFATKSAHPGRHGRRPAGPVTGVLLPRTANRPTGDRRP